MRGPRTTRGPRWVLLLVCSLWMLVASAASAQGATTEENTPRGTSVPRVLVVEPSADDAALFEAFGRLRAELQLQHFEVDVLEVGVRTPEDLEREAQSRGAFAVVALVRGQSGTTADVCIVDRVTGKTTIRRLSIETSRDGPTLLAIRAVDLLRASLGELSPGQRPPKDVLGVERKPLPPQVEAFAHQEARFQLRAGGVMLASPTLGPAMGVGLAFRYRAVPRLALGLGLGGPLFGGVAETPSGAAQVRQEFALAQLALNLGSTRAGQRFEWGPVLGVGVNHLAATGKVDLPLVAQSGEVWSLALQGGLGAELFFGETVSLALELGCLGLVPQPVIAVSDERSSALGLQALGNLSLGLSF